MEKNEVLELLKSSKRQNNMVGILPGSDIGNTIIKELEEVQQYRETGHTPAMVRDLIRGYKTEHAQNMKLVNELEDYQQIGTPEELRVLKDKQVAKKVSLRRVRKVDGFDIGECPTCGEDVSRDCDGIDIFCPYCGQKLNWEDEE